MVLGVWGSETSMDPGSWQVPLGRGLYSCPGTGDPGGVLSGSGWNHLGVWGVGYRGWTYRCGSDRGPPRPGRDRSSDLGGRTRRTSASWNADAGRGRSTTAKSTTSRAARAATTLADIDRGWTRRTRGRSSGTRRLSRIPVHPSPLPESRLSHPRPEYLYPWEGHRPDDHGFPPTFVGERTTTRT